MQSKQYGLNFLSKNIFLCQKLKFFEKCAKILGNALFCGRPKIAFSKSIVSEKSQSIKKSHHLPKIPQKSPKPSKIF
jgi:hypothetical protein